MFFFLFDIQTPTDNIGAIELCPREGDKLVRHSCEKCVTDARKYHKMPYLIRLMKVRGIVIVAPHPGSHQHQNLIMSISPLGHVYQVWSTFINVFLSHLVDRQTHVRVTTSRLSPPLYRGKQIMNDICLKDKTEEFLSAGFILCIPQ